MGRLTAAGALLAAALLSPAAAQDPQGPFLGVLEGHGGPVKGVAAAGALVATASFDYAIGLWDPSNGGRIAWLDGHDAAVNAVTFSGKTRLVSVGDDFTARLWDLEAQAQIATLEGHKGKVTGVAASADGRMAATAGWDGRVGLWDLETGDNLAWLDGHKASVLDVVFSPDGAHLFSASADGELRRWRVSDARLVRVEAKHGFNVNALAIDPDGEWIAYGAADGVTRVLDLETGAEIAALTGDRRPILAVATSASGASLAYGDGHGFISVVDASTWVILRDYRAALRGPIWALAFVGEDRLVASGLEDEAAIWPVGGPGADPEAALGEAAPTRFKQTAETLATASLPPKLLNGAAQFARKCSVCHTLTPDGARRAGPSLYGVFGRRAGTLDGYGYSKALLSSTLVWSEETINRLFDEGPEIVTPGSKMPMQVIAKEADRRDLVAYLAHATAAEE